MVSAIIVAGGRGNRFKSDLAKQYQRLVGRSVLSHTLSVFASCDAVDDLILVVPAGHEDYCRESVLPEVAPVRDLKLVAGGKQRQDSVFNGLRAVSGNGDGKVLIHDGVRPFVSSRLINDCLAGLEHAVGCIAAVPAVDTLKLVDAEDTITNTLERTGVWLAQTPQAFRYDIILKAHEAAAGQGWQGTDDASLLEWQGYAVKVVPGATRNIKITTPADLALAEAMLSTVDVQPG